MRGWLIYDKDQAVRNEWVIRHYIETAARSKITLSLLFSEDIYIHFENGTALLSCSDGYLTPVDFCIFRSWNFTLHEIIEQMGIPTFNSSHLSRIANDKACTYAFANALSLPILPTLITSDTEPPEDMEWPLVVKPRCGHGGDRVCFVPDPLSYGWAIANLVEDKSWIVQKCASQHGRDLRIYIINDKPIAAMMRKARRGIVSNYCLNGLAHPHALSHEEMTIVEAITAKQHIDYGGIDLLYDRGRPVLNELEDAVGARMLYSLTGIDPVKLYLEHVLTTL